MGKHRATLNPLLSYPQSQVTFLPLFNPRGRCSRRWQRHQISRAGPGEPRQEPGAGVAGDQCGARPGRAAVRPGRAFGIWHPWIHV